MRSLASSSTKRREPSPKQYLFLVGGERQFISSQPSHLATTDPIDPWMCTRILHYFQQRRGADRKTIRAKEGDRGHSFTRWRSRSTSLFFLLPCLGKFSFARDDKSFSIFYFRQKGKQYFLNEYFYCTFFFPTSLPKHQAKKTRPASQHHAEGTSLAAHVRAQQGNKN